MKNSHGYDQISTKILKISTQFIYWSSHLYFDK
jgi:hypothetical protein